MYKVMYRLLDHGGLADLRDRGRRAAAGGRGQAQPGAEERRGAQGDRTQSKYNCC